jgi:hypothetical protein
MGLKIDHLLRNFSDQISMLYTTNNEVRMVNGEKEAFEYDRLDNVAILEVQTSNMNGREWANSRIKLQLLACITRRYHGVET